MLKVQQLWLCLPVDGAQLYLQLQSSCRGYFDCQWGVQVWLELRVWNCYFCSSAIWLWWCWLVSAPMCVLVFVFNVYSDSKFLSSLTSSDTHKWKVQRSTLETDCHRTDTTWWAVISREYDLAFVIFWPEHSKELWVGPVCHSSMKDRQPKIEVGLWYCLGNALY